MDWYLEVLRKYAVFRGRSRRKEFWFFVLFDLLFGFASIGVDLFVGTFNRELQIGLLSAIYMLALFVPRLALSVRRLHDIGLSGWLTLIWLVPFIGPIVLFVLAAFVSQPGENKYGPCPLTKDVPPSRVPA